MPFVANPLAFGGSVSDAYTTPFPYRLGQLVSDADGNQYRFCTAGEPIAPEQVLVIDPSWNATKLTSTSTRGLVGVAPDYAKLGQSANTPTVHASYQWTSDNGLWVQVWGRAYIGIGAADTSPSDAANGPTTAETSARIIFRKPTAVVTPLGTPVMASGGTGVFGTSGAVIIENMWVATDVTLGDVSGAVGSSGVAVTEPTNMASFHAIGRIAVQFYNPYLKVVNSVTD